MSLPHLVSPLQVVPLLRQLIRGQFSLKTQLVQNGSVRNAVILLILSWVKTRPFQVGPKQEVKTAHLQAGLAECFLPVNSASLAARSLIILSVSGSVTEEREEQF